jgi:WD40 repeat protein
MGKTPQALAPSAAQVEMVACHPTEDVVAVGYADGLILIVRRPDGAEILARKPATAPVTALSWSGDGKLLAFGTEDGDAGIVESSHGLTSRGVDRGAGAGSFRHRFIRRPQRV